MAEEPNPIAVALAILRARRVRRPSPRGGSPHDHDALAPVLDDLRRHGVAALPDHRPTLLAYRDALAEADPDELDRDEALAYWLNCYNAGALHLAAAALEAGTSTVLRVPGAFDRPWIAVAGEVLSLNAIEHGKIRRFGDPRIHGALVCGSVSCPTLRHEPYRGATLDEQLDAQFRTFLAGGGASLDRGQGALRLSRIFLWYGGDFTRPRRMPTWLPARRRTLAPVVARWLPAEDAGWIRHNRPKVTFAPYDWGLACAIA